MKYVPPVGASDPEESYVTGDPASGVQGSRVSGAAIENPQREIIKCIKDAGLTPDDADIGQLAKAVRAGRTTAPQAGEIGESDLAGFVDLEVLSITDSNVHVGSITPPSAGVWIFTSEHLLYGSVTATVLGRFTIQIGTNHYFTSTTYPQAGSAELRHYVTPISAYFGWLSAGQVIPVHIQGTNLTASASISRLNMLHWVRVA